METIDKRSSEVAIISVAPISDPVMEASQRPFWSVMIPTYNPSEDHLEQTLRSVLAQDPGSEKMQIEVLDDCSFEGPPNHLVRRIGGDRVLLHREPRNLGLAGIWNRCIERARGDWVHILHQDDLVLPGFYKNLMAGAGSPASPGLIYCRCAFMDEDGHWTSLSRIEAKKAGILDGALERLVRRQILATPAVVVRRSAYAAVGGFRTDLCYTLDWEMWCRVASKYPIWFEPQILACYRTHSGNTTHRLVLEGKDIEDARKCINIINHFLPDTAVAAQVKRYSLKLAALFALENARSFLHKKMFAAAWRQVHGALKCGVRMTVVWRLLVFGFGATARLPKKTILKVAKMAHKTNLGR